MLNSNTNEQKLYEKKVLAAKEILDKQKNLRKKNRGPITLSRGAKKRIENAIAALPENERNNVNAIASEIAFRLYDDHVGTDETEENGTLEYQAERQQFSKFYDIIDRVEYYLSSYGTKKSNQSKL